MMILLWIVVLLLALLGLVELMRMLSLLLLRPSRRLKMLLPMTIDDSGQDAEFLLRSAAARAKWMGGNVEVVAIDCGLSEEGLSLSRKVCRQVGAQLIQVSEVPRLLGCP